MGALVFIIGAAYIYSKKFKNDEYYEDDDDESKMIQQQPPTENKNFYHHGAAAHLRANEEEAAISATSSYRSTHQPSPSVDKPALLPFREDVSSHFQSVSSFNEMDNVRSEPFVEEKVISRRDNNNTTCSVEL